jgi:prevent-host-death family protein
VPAHEQHPPPTDGHGNVTMVMSERTVPISRFKAECLSMLDSVARTGEEIVVTKRGRPIARVIAAVEPESLLGSVRFLVGDEELVAPLDAGWDAEES